MTVFGATRNDVPGLASVTRPGGLLAQTSNIGTYRSSSFTLIPELDLHLGCRLTDRISVSAGYSFLLLTDVARAGDQIDLVVNPNLLPGAPAGTGPARPAFVMRQTNTWVQGINLGLSVKW
ncbi:BBP7 family outer membrane beta-barrel protein [Gemmata palustris]|uniref:BBP7 family outer membrane beta-barrel protein n=1 Tax=Gemmata palustris TaxID=2822762 RepID=UPI0028F3E49C|nr:BBP7 family outer membrane beta-barrel protein [Gemmata palustris]